MPISVRLDEDTRRILNRLARQRRLSQSEVVRRGIRLLAENEPREDTANPYETLRHLVGRIHGGPDDLSEQTGRGFRRILVARRARHR